jgi:excisionase family DNA binding protein
MRREKRRYYTVRDFARIAGVHWDTVYKWIRTERIRSATPFGACVMHIPRSEVIGYLATRPHLRVPYELKDAVTYARKKEEQTLEKWKKGKTNE